MKSRGGSRVYEKERKRVREEERKRVRQKEGKREKKLMGSGIKGMKERDEMMTEQKDEKKA